jgi:hypothetical protein
LRSIMVGKNKSDRRSDLNRRIKQNPKHYS